MLSTWLVLTHTAYAAPPDYWVSTSYETVFRDTARPAVFANKIEVLAVRNEYESEQVNPRHSLSSFVVIDIVPSSLTDGRTQFRVAAFITVLIASLSWHFLELPINRLKRYLPFPASV